MALEISFLLRMTHSFDSLLPFSVQMFAGATELSGLDLQYFFRSNGNLLETLPKPDTIIYDLEILPAQAIPNQWDSVYCGILFSMSKAIGIWLSLSVTASKWMHSDCALSMCQSTNNIFMTIYLGLSCCFYLKFIITFSYEENMVSVILQHWIFLPSIFLKIVA